MMLLSLAFVSINSACGMYFAMKERYFWLSLNIVAVVANATSVINFNGCN